MGELVLSSGPPCLVASQEAPVALVWPWRLLLLLLRSALDWGSIGGLLVAVAVPLV